MTHCQMDHLSEDIASSETEPFSEFFLHKETDVGLA